MFHSGYDHVSLNVWLYGDWNTGSDVQDTGFENKISLFIATSKILNSLKH